MFFTEQIPPKPSPSQNGTIFALRHVHAIANLAIWPYKLIHNDMDSELQPCQFQSLLTSTA